MRFVGKSKIGRLSAKKGKIYAQMRLPASLTDTIGEIADVFETERHGKSAFLLVTKQNVLDNSMVLQPSETVVKPDHETNNDRRIKALKSQIAELKSLILQKSIESEEDKENQRPRARDSNPRRGLLFLIFIDPFA
jgi:hypothetical protein